MLIRAVVDLDHVLHLAVTFAMVARELDYPGHCRLLISCGSCTTFRLFLIEMMPTGRGRLVRFRRLVDNLMMIVLLLVSCSTRELVLLHLRLAICT